MKKAEEVGWRIAETEIDLLAIGKGAKEYLVGECKFKGHPFTYSEYLDTLVKLSPLKKKQHSIMRCFQRADLMNGLKRKRMEEMCGFIRCTQS